MSFQQPVENIFLKYNFIALETILQKHFRHIVFWVIMSLNVENKDSFSSTAHCKAELKRYRFVL